MMKVLCAIALLTIVWLKQCNAGKKSKHVTTHLDSKWYSGPLILEVSEYLFEDNPESFWSFIEDVNALGSKQFQEYDTDKEYYENVIQAASKYVSASGISLLKFSLSLREYSPRIEMFRQMSADRDIPEECEAAADINGRLVCNVEEVESAVDSQKEQPKPDIFKIDHKYPIGEGSSVRVILYAQLGTELFSKFHGMLRELAEEGRIEYVMRHWVSDKELTASKVRLSGYGVELQIKSTEYKAQDDTKVKSESKESETQEEQEDEIDGFVFSKLRSLYPSHEEQLNKFKSHLEEESDSMAPLKVWELQELSLQAAERVMGSSQEEALKVLTHLAQNFPTQARSLVKTKVREQLKREINKNQNVVSNDMNLQPGDTALFLNGMFLDVDAVDMFTLLEYIREEHKVLLGLHKLGFQQDQIENLISLDLASKVDGYAVDIRDSAIMYINDIETDSDYKKWPDSVMDLLRPMFPGMLQRIRRNMFHLVMVVDPSTNDAKDILKMAESFYVHRVPLRIGVVFAVDPSDSVTGLTDPGVALLNAFNFISQESDPYQALSFITDVYADVKDNPVTIKDVHKAFKKQFKHEDLEDVFGSDSEYDTGRRLAKDFLARTGFKRLPQVLMNGVSLPESSLRMAELEEAVVMELGEQMHKLQRAVYKGELMDHHNILDYLMSQPNVMPRLNERILSENNRYVDLSEHMDEKLTPDTLDTFLALSGPKMASVIAGSLKYVIRKPDPSVFRPLTIWVVADLETKDGRDLLNNAITHARIDDNIRVGVIHNPLGEETVKSRALQAILESLPETAYPARIMSKALEDKHLATLSGSAAGLVKLTGEDIEEKDVQEAQQSSEAVISAHKVFCRRVLGFAPGQMGVISNGKIIGPLDSNETLVEEDFNLIEKFTSATSLDKITDSLQKFADFKQSSDVVMRTSASLLSHLQPKQRHKIKFDHSEYSVLKLAPKNPDAPAVDLVGVCDPLSRGAQKLAPLLMILQEVVNCNIRLFLNAKSKHSDMPLKSFYRFVLEPELQFTSEGMFTPGPQAKFTNLPGGPVLTQQIHVPENWLVEVVTTPFDLDNINLDQVESGIYSKYELEYLLLEGHCFEASSGNPPRGLQFNLGTTRLPDVVDTIVMANLGYFQLKANPGAWSLKLREGRSSEIYDIVSHEGTDTPAESVDVKIVISTFRSALIKVRVNKKPDKAHMNLLTDEGDESGGIWGSITSTFGGGEPEESHDVINIFSLASGHLYERLLRIMMLSVLKHTKTPVHFWFLKNYLSPTVKDFLPVMAEEYGFNYSLVEYKWPRWLHQQTEKQRMIWGYKILFLDVLFPLNVKKIIFVDADQVVRTDLKELMDLDLGGAPYGYTPFCESRKEMDGYRFWKSGYWRNHLGSRSYHISALYVVDLKKFRRIAAGDRLRGQYQGLSQDPNSLSNLDQDLPNNMIHQVAIKSLPQEWLWCETWCDDASKKYAKTIDLCNNPQTKESKLTAAMRIIPEWKDYDNEIKNLQKRVASKPKDKTSHEHIEL